MVILQGTCWKRKFQSTVYYYREYNVNSKGNYTKRPPYSITNWWYFLPQWGDAWCFGPLRHDLRLKVFVQIDRWIVSNVIVCWLPSLQCAFLSDDAHNASHLFAPMVVVFVSHVCGIST